MDGLSEVVRVLEAEGWLWVEPFKVSKQALANDLLVYPRNYGDKFLSW